MSNIFARLLEEGDRQQQQLQQQTTQRGIAVDETQDDSTTARQHAVKTARQYDTMTARQHDSMNEYVDGFLQSRAKNKTTLRYPPSLMNDLDEVIYQIKRTYGVSLSKNEIFVLALANVIYDFKRNAAHSTIYTSLLKDEEKQR